MVRFVITPRLGDYSHPGLLAFAQTVAAEMNGNLNYPTPVPALIDLGTDITAYSDALTAWGPEGNRGSHVQYNTLLDARVLLEADLTTLANYCMSTTPYDKAAFLSGGWEVKSENVPVGIVGPVVGLHQFISNKVPSGAVRLIWKRPAGAPRGSVSAYQILHSLTADVNTATQIGLSTKTTFTHLTAGNFAGNFYWVIPVTVAGAGGIADVVPGYPQGPVIC